MQNYHLPTTHYLLRTRTRAAFTLVELLVVVAIMAVVAGTSALYLGKLGANTRVINIGNEIVTLLRTAQANAVSQTSASPGQPSARWGLYIDNTNVSAGNYDLFVVDDTLLADGTFTGMPGTSIQHLNLPTGVSFTQPAGGTKLRVIFNRATGLPLSTATIVLVSTAGSSMTISVDVGGRINA